ncbi:uncharacterized protein METZ01_LOCUS384643, partial [marine metagenome]
YEIEILSLDDNVSFETSASATGTGNAAYSYDVDSFVYATKAEDGSLTPYQASIQVLKDGSGIHPGAELTVTDLSDSAALPVSVALSSISASGASLLSASSDAADVALGVASNALLQARADLAGNLVDEATARARKLTYEEALNEAKGRLDTDLEDLFTGEDGADLGPLDRSLSVVENLAVNAAKVDGASHGQAGTTLVSYANGGGGVVTLNLTEALAADGTLTDTVMVASQSGSITLSGTVEAGDVYRLTVDGYPVGYTITADDVAAGMTIEGLRDAFVVAINADEDIKEIVVA